jgi:AraC-like DNA-binding protein
LEWLVDLEKTVREHIGSPHLSIDFIADEMHISRAQFYRRLQSLTGLTPNQYLQEILFNHARQLLEQRRVNSVKAASAAIGVQSVQYFSAQFKTRFGKSPSEYLT